MSIIKALSYLLPLRVFASRSAASDPLMKYRYRVTIDGVSGAFGFSKVSGLKRTLNVSKYAEGGFKSERKLRGRESVDDVTLERGVFAGDEDLYTLYKNAYNNVDYRTTVKVELHDKFGNVQKSWTLGEAFITVWEGTDFDASSDDVAIEKLTIAFENFID